MPDDLPVFEGSRALLRLIATAVRRPRHGERPEPERLRGVAQGREGLPVICLVGEGDSAHLTRSIGKFLREADPRRVPHAVHTYARRDGAGDGAPRAPGAHPGAGATDATPGTGTDSTPTAAGTPTGTSTGTPAGAPTGAPGPSAAASTGTAAATVDGPAPGVDGSAREPAGLHPELSFHDVRATLAQLAQGLASSVNGGDGRVRFRRFGLVNWLMQQGPDRRDEEAEPQHDRTLFQGLRLREFRRRWFPGVLRGPETELVLESTAPWYVQIAVRLLPFAWFRVRRGLGAEYRWLLHQPYLAPGDPGTFIGFAERLTAPHNQVEDAEQLNKLMVNAFLEDLRVAYRRRMWRPRGARRTSYCVALLDGATEHNTGHLLLRTVVDVRNETGAFDPLLVVSCGQEPPAHGPLPLSDWGDRGLWNLNPLLYEGWRDNFLRKGRDRTRAPWYLPVSVPALLTPAHPAYEKQRRLELVPDGQLRLPAPPRLARRGVVVPAVCLAAVLAVLSVALPVVRDPGAADWERTHCGLDRDDPDSATLRTEKGGECVGVAPHGFTFHSDDATLNDALGTIARQNKRADALHLANPRRPLITLIQLSALISSAGRPSSQLSYARESLQGAASAQSRQLHDNLDDEAPILRLYPANAGTGMGFGTEAVKIIAGMREEDPSIVGVTGLDQSRKATNDTIRALTRVGLPMVGTTLSADSLTDQSPLYFQVSPQNEREAQIAAAYARHRIEQKPSIQRKVRTVYSADPSDIYSQNLRTDAVKSFRRAGFEVEQQAYTPPAADGSRRAAAHRTARSLGMESCGYQGVVFFAGRSEDFQSLLDGINQVCDSFPPEILGGDDVARLAADQVQRTRYPGLTYSFLDFTVGSTSCASDSELYTEMENLFPKSCDTAAAASLDGHAALAFDAVRLFVDAVMLLQDAAPELPVSAAAVWHAITGVHGKSSLEGESGTISFGGNVERQVPIDKLISVQVVDKQGVPRQDGFCGRRGQLKQAGWCPELEEELEDLRSPARGPGVPAP